MYENKSASLPGDRLNDKKNMALDSTSEGASILEKKKNSWGKER